MSATDDDKNNSSEHTSQGVPTDSVDAQEQFTPFDPQFIESLRVWRSMEPGPPTNVLSPVPAETASADEFASWFKDNLPKISSIMDSVPHTDLPSAFIPPTFLGPEEETERMYTRKRIQDSFNRIMSLGFNTLDTINKLETNLSMATAISQLHSMLPNPGSSTRPVPADDTNPAWIAISTALNTFASSPGADADLLWDWVRTNETILGYAILELGKFLETATEHTLPHTYAKSLFGLVILFLYELNREDECLIAGIGSTTIAFNRSRSGVTISGGVDYTPTFTRCWAYGQRLKAQQYKDYDILDVVITTTNSVLQDCDKHPELFAPRSVKLLVVELCECFLAKYRAIGGSENLDHIIDALTKFTEDAPASILSVIGNAYFERFRSYGDISDLDNCLQFARRGSMVMGSKLIDGIDGVDFFQVECCHLLSLALHESYQQHGQPEDIDAAILECENAISQLPQTHFLQSNYKSDLADCLSTRFLAEAKLEDINRAFKESESALTLLKEITPAAMPPKVIRGSVLTLRGAHTKNCQDLSDAISLLINARKEFIGRTHLESHIEYHLSRAFQERYWLSKEEDDLDMALHHAKASLKKAESKAPRRGQFILHLGQLFATAWKNNSIDQESHFDAARQSFMDVLSSSAAPLTRLQAAIEWATLAEASEDAAQALEALQAGLLILPELAWIGHKMLTRYRLISAQSAELSRRATMHAIELSNLETAVQVLESGRSIIWSHALQPHNVTAISGQDSYEAMLLAQGLAQRAHDETIDFSQFKDTGRRLPPGFVDMLETLQGFVEMTQRKLVSQKPDDPKHQARVERDMGWAKLERARFQGLDRATSLRSAAQRLEKLQRDRTTQSTASPPALQLCRNPQLLSILQRGTIVVLNVYRTKCDAIILSSKEAEIALDHIPLPNMSAEDAYEFVNTLHCGIREMYTDSITPGDLLGDLEEAFIIPVLQELWYRIVNPVLERIGELKSSSLPRIWWYPTGPLAFLPIHAAGPYTDDEGGLPELSISSYISSIQSLLRADSAPTSPFHMLGVGQPKTPGQPPLPAVEREMEALLSSCQDDPTSLTTLVGQDGNVYAVKQALPNHTWLHFSGHAVQDQRYPFDSALHLHDGPLKLAQLMQLNLSSIQFAFLSACMTSQGDPWTPDENIHLAAGLQFAGARSVIGTMWSVDDETAAQTSREVYKHLFRNGIGGADPREAAEALHVALNNLKDSLPLYARVPIMHTGL